MCTKEETKQAVYEALAEPNEQGQNIIEEHINLAMKRIVGKLTFRFGVAFITLLLSGAGTWYALYYQVQQNSALIDDGGRFTQEEADNRDSEYQRQFLELKEADVQIREDVNNSMNILRSDIREIRNLILSSR